MEILFGIFIYIFLGAITAIFSYQRYAKPLIDKNDLDFFLPVILMFAAVGIMFWPVGVPVIAAWELINWIKNNVTTGD